MERRYQVFVSSTFTDLENERRMVMEALLKAQCLPAGMELFPASSQEQLDVIKRVIDDSDYYVLIVGGRYGSIANGLSYTEQEFDYAIEQDVPVFAFIHGQPDSLPFNHSEPDPAIRAQLERFREKVKTGRVVNFFTDRQQLASQVSLAIERAKSQTPAEGWVRGKEINRLTAELNELKHQVQNARTTLISNDISGSDDEYILTAELNYITNQAAKASFDVDSADTTEASVHVPTTWREIFLAVGSALFKSGTYSDILSHLSGLAVTRVNNDVDLQPPDFQKATSAWAAGAFDQVVIQLLAQGLIARVDQPNTNREWKFTDPGLAEYVNLKAIRKQPADTTSD